MEGYFSAFRASVFFQIISELETLRQNRACVFTI